MSFWNWKSAEEKKREAAEREALKQAGKTPEQAWVEDVQRQQEERRRLEEERQAAASSERKRVESAEREEERQLKHQRDTQQGQEKYEGRVRREGERAKRAALKTAQLESEAAQKFYKKQSATLSRERREGTFKELGKYAGAATKAILPGKRSEESLERSKRIYLGGKQPKGFYGGDSPAKEALGTLPSTQISTPNLGSLQEATEMSVHTPSRMLITSAIKPSTSLARVEPGRNPLMASKSGMSGAMDRLRSMTLMKFGSPGQKSPESVVLSELTSSGPQTPSQIISRLGELGVSATEASSTINYLLSMKAIRKRPEFRGEQQLLEVA
jgi:hypothetical protein